QFLTPQVWKQVHQAWRPSQAASRWTLQPLFWVLLSMTWCCGDSEGERFATARAFYVSCHQRRRRPGDSLQGFQIALARLPMRVGNGTASEHFNLRCLLSTLPRRALIVADAFYQVYELYAAILAAKASFLVRLSSRSRLYKEGMVRLDRFRQGLVYYWPEKTAQDQGKPPLQLRLLRVRGPNAHVWLWTHVLDPRELNQ